MSSHFKDLTLKKFNLWSYWLDNFEKKFKVMIMIYRWLFQILAIYMSFHSHDIYRFSLLIKHFLKLLLNIVQQTSHYMPLYVYNILYVKGKKAYAGHISTSLYTLHIEIMHIYTCAVGYGACQQWDKPTLSRPKSMKLYELSVAVWKKNVFKIYEMSAY